MNILPRCLWLALVCLALSSLATHLQAKPLFQPNDIVALVGGEDMVAAAEYGELELLITKALPDHGLKFRSLAWEGDTVYEQRRDLNYPTLEQQLETIGASVVICQFGTMESLDGPDRIPDFIAAYDKLLTRLQADGKRRILALPPVAAETSSSRRAVLREYQTAIENLATQRSFVVVDVSSLGKDDTKLHRDAIHLSRAGHALLARTFALKTNLTYGPREELRERAARLQQAIIEKNRLWFHYYRPQNWAFLAGDRTNQPSSRDHRDPSKRWFPAELEEFLPLIEKKETEIHALAKEITK